MGQIFESLCFFIRKKIVSRYVLASSFFYYFLSFLLGSASYFIFAPYFTTSLLLFIIVALMELWWKKPYLALGIGFFFGLGHFISTLYWIASAVKMAGMDHIAHIGALGVSVFLALYYGMAGWCVKRFKCFIFSYSNNVHLLFALFVTNILMLVQWGQGHWFTGFPWTLWAYGLSIDNPLLQATSLVGAYGLSYLILLWCALTWWFLKTRKKIYIIVPIMTAFLWMYGEKRLHNAPMSSLPKDTFITIVQPCIPQVTKWSEHYFWDTMRTLRLLSNPPSTPSLIEKKSPHLIIWPEASVPAFVQNNDSIQDFLLKSLPSKESILLFGAPYVKSDNIYTSLFSINIKEGIQHLYNKTHLVPFGEYLPFRFVIRAIGLKKLTHGMEDYAFGEGAKTVDKKNIPPFSPMICYEIIFPRKVIDPSSIKRPEWILTITNDAWFGTTTAPFQHLHMVRVRAIEEGLPVIRAANNGISAIINPYGKSVAHLELNQRGIVQDYLPAFISPPFFAQWGHWPLLFMVSTVFLLILLMLIVKKSPLCHE
jgi:apolipoprotein N-acyltransferase